MDLCKTSTANPRKRADVVLLEFPHSVEEIGLASGQRKVGRKFRLQEFDSADEIGDLKEPVTLRGYVGREGHARIEKRAFEDCTDLRLSVIVEDLDRLVGRKAFGVPREISGYLPGQGGLHRLRCIAETLVNAESTVADRRSACKCDDAPEKLPAHGYVHVRKYFFASDKRSGMDTYSWVSEVGELTFKFFHELGDAFTLIVEYEGDEVKTRRNHGRVETSRLVDKYTQLTVCSHAEIKIGGELSPPSGGSGFRLCQKSFPLTRYIVANRAVWRKGAA